MQTNRSSQYTVEIQINGQWETHFHTDDVEEARDEADSIWDEPVRIVDISGRIIRR